MSDYQLPSDGSIIIIEDKPKEAYPLIQLFCKKGAACTYYTGKDKELPDTPCQKVRLAFVDIELAGKMSPENNATTILSKLDKIIHENNGPYILVIWTTQDEVYANVLQDQVTSKNFAKRPIIVLRLNKKSFFETSFDATHQEELIEAVDDRLSAIFSEEHRNDIKDFIKEASPPKEEFRAREGAIDLIGEALQEELKKLGAFHLFIIWENLINKASGEIVKNYSSLHEKDEYWDKNHKYSLYKMAKAQLGNLAKGSSEDELIKSALVTLNSAFLDEVENRIHSLPDLHATVTIDKNNLSFSKKIGTDEYKLSRILASGKYKLYINSAERSTAPDGHKAPDKIINSIKDPTPDIKKNVADLVAIYNKVQPEINTSLLLDFNAKKYVRPGHVYVKDVEKTKKIKLLSTYFKPDSSVLNSDGTCRIDDAALAKIKFIELEVTPPCDFAQGKWLKSRMLPGILVPDEYNDEKTLIQDGPYYLDIPIIRVDDLNYRLIFDYRLLKSIDKKAYSEITPLFRLRNELHADIISHLSSHVSRLGITIVD